MCLHVNCILSVLDFDGSHKGGECMLDNTPLMLTMKKFSFHCLLTVLNETKTFSIVGLDLCSILNLSFFFKVRLPSKIKLIKSHLELIEVISGVYCPNVWSRP